MYNTIQSWADRFVTIHLCLWCIYSLIFAPPYSCVNCTDEKLYIKFAFFLLAARISTVLGFVLIYHTNCYTKIYDFKYGLLLSQYCSSPHCAQRWGLECPHWQPFLTQHAQLLSSKSCGQVHPEAFAVHRSIWSETRKKNVQWKNKVIDDDEALTAPFSNFFGRSVA